MPKVVAYEQPMSIVGESASPNPKRRHTGSVQVIEIYYLYRLVCENLLLAEIIPGAVINVIEFPGYLCMADDAL